MYKLSVVGDAHARPDELARQVANLFELDFQLLQSVQGPARNIIR
jgi:hypothetical protein